MCACRILRKVYLLTSPFQPTVNFRLSLSYLQFAVQVCFSLTSTSQTARTAAYIDFPLSLSLSLLAEKGTVSSCDFELSSVTFVDELDLDRTVVLTHIHRYTHKHTQTHAQTHIRPTALPGH